MSQTEFRVFTDNGPMLIAADTYEQAEAIAKRDGHIVSKPDPYYTLPISIADNYKPPMAMGEPKIIRVAYPNDRRIEIFNGKKTDVWVWDTDNPGHGRWLQIG